jgi:hypothetical protein
MLETPIWVVVITVLVIVAVYGRFFAERSGCGLLIAGPEENPDEA